MLPKCEKPRRKKNMLQRKQQFWDRELRLLEPGPKMDISGWDLDIGVGLGGELISGGLKQIRQCWGLKTRILDEVVVAFPGTFWGQNIINM